MAKTDLELRARVIELRRQGASYAEVALIVGCPTASVSTIIRRHAPELGGYRTDPATGLQIRGFASMGAGRRLEIATKGGASVPADKRSFSTSRALAESAGRKGGQASRGGGRTSAAMQAEAAAPKQAA